jgi:hypothetical protein
MKRFYPAAPLPWAKQAGQLSRDEAAYGISEGFLEAALEQPETQMQPAPLATMGTNEMAVARDVLFRLLLLNLYRHWFLYDYPMRALEWLVLDFEDCPSTGIGDGRLPSGIAGISETEERPELDPKYFAQKVRVFRSLTPYVTAIVDAGVRAPFAVAR